MKISDEVLNVLERSVVTENYLVLPEQLDRKLYQAVNKVLECLGGKWNRGTKAHVFLKSPIEMIDEAMITGEVTDEKKEFQFFRTPKAVAMKLVAMAEIKGRMSVLEPSAGDGAIVEAIHTTEIIPDAVELNAKNKGKLDNMCLSVRIGDFLSINPGFYDRMIGNPPFCKQQDVDHVLHMYRYLKPGGILVSVMSPSWRFRENKKSVEFRQFIADRAAEVIDLPEGTFKESGTMVRACIVKIRKPL